MGEEMQRHRTPCRISPGRLMTALVLLMALDDARDDCFYSPEQRKDIELGMLVILIAVAADFIVQRGT